MFTYYFVGHNFEYEARNALRIFDLNADYNIKYEADIIDDIGISLLSVLYGNNGGFKSSAELYKEGRLLYKAEYDGNNIELEDNNEKKLKKTLVVKAIHNVLKKYYKINPDYGILTGVRPVKILFAAKNHDKSPAEINNILENTYEVSPDKIKLLWEVSKVEELYIDKEINKKNYNLYIGIPFCPSKCNYCSFTSFVNSGKSTVSNYLQNLIYEIESTIELALRKNLKLNTVYFGGGTPSILNNEQINKIFKSIKKYYDLSKISEITFEAGRPDTITSDKLKCLKENYVGRISINPQTMDDTTLINIGRNHSVNDITDKYEMARKIGFNSINMDVILGLPDENTNDVINTMNEIIKLQPENITVHTLSYKRNSQLTKESIELSKDYEILKKMQSAADKICNGANYYPYYMYRQKNIKGNLENIGYALPGKECVYNIIIIEEIETILACGAGSTSKILFENNRHESVHNYKSLEEYNRRLNEIISKKKDILNESRI